MDISHDTISRIFSRQLMNLPIEKIDINRGDKNEKRWNLFEKD